MVYMYHSFLIHSSADGHLGCFHVLAMINSAVMNIGVHVSLSDLVSLVCMPRSGIAEATELCGYRSKHWQQRDVGVNVVCTKHNNGLILDKHPPNHFKIL